MLWAWPSFTGSRLIREHAFSSGEILACWTACTSVTSHLHPVLEIFCLCWQQRPSILKPATARFFLCLEDLGRGQWQGCLPDRVPPCFLHVPFPKLLWVRSLSEVSLGVRVSKVVAPFSSSLPPHTPGGVEIRPEDLVLPSVRPCPGLVTSSCFFSLSLSLVQCLTVLCLKCYFCATIDVSL